MDARTLLELAADFVDARRTKKFADGYGVEPATNADEIAARFDDALRQYVQQTNGQ